MRPLSWNILTHRVMINTPMDKITVCSKVNITWMAGNVSTSVKISIVKDGDNPNTQAVLITTIANVQKQSSYSWLVNVPEGTYYYLGTTDDKAVMAYSGKFTITTGSNTSCLSGGGTVTTSATATPLCPICSSGLMTITTGSTTSIKSTGSGSIKPTSSSGPTFVSAGVASYVVPVQSALLLLLGLYMVM